MFLRDQNLLESLGKSTGLLIQKYKYIIIRTEKGASSLQEQHLAACFL